MVKICIVFEAWTIWELPFIWLLINGMTRCDGPNQYLNKVIVKRVLIVLMILNSLLNERWSISFKLYKRKKKPHIVNVQFTELLAKPIKETLIIQKPIDCKLNWKPIAGTVIINVCYTVFYNVKLGISFPHRGLWSTRFVWGSDSNQAAMIVPLCSQNYCDGNLMQPSQPTQHHRDGQKRKGGNVTVLWSSSHFCFMCYPADSRGMAESPGPTFLATVSVWELHVKQTNLSCVKCWLVLFCCFFPSQQISTGCQCCVVFK